MLIKTFITRAMFQKFLMVSFQLICIKMVDFTTTVIFC